MKRILLTGMSGTGKSTVISELAVLGFKAVDLDTCEFSHWIDVEPDRSKYELPAPGKDRVWRVDRVERLLEKDDTDILFVSGCAENMTTLLPKFDHVVLLSAPAQVVAERLRARSNNPFGKRPEELTQVMALLESVEPLLRKVADTEIDTTLELRQIVTKVLALAHAVESKKS